VRYTQQHRDERIDGQMCDALSSMSGGRLSAIFH